MRYFFKDQEGNIVPVPPESEQAAIDAGWTDASDEEADDYLLQEAKEAEQSGMPNVEELLQPYRKENYDLYRSQGLGDEEALQKARDAYTRDKVMGTIMEADPAFKDAGDNMSAIGSYVENALDSAGLGMVKFIEGGIGQALRGLGFENNWLTPEAIELRDRANPTAKLAGDITGMIGPMAGSLALKAVPKLARAPVIGRVAKGFAGVDELTGGKIAEKVNQRVLVDKASRSAIKNEVERMGLSAKDASAIESELLDQLVVEQLQKLGVPATSLERVGNTIRETIRTGNKELIKDYLKVVGKSMAGPATQGAIQGAVRGLGTGLVDIQRGAISEDLSAGSVDDILQGAEYLGKKTAEGGITGGVLGGVGSVVIPQGINAVGFLVRKTNDGLGWLARNTPIVGVPSVGSLLGRATKRELTDAMIKEAEAKQPQFVENVNRVAESFDDEIISIDNQRRLMHKDLVEMNMLTNPDISRASARLIADQQMQALDNSITALNASSFRNKVRGNYVTDKNALLSWIGQQKIPNNTNELMFLPNEYAAVRNEFYAVNDRMENLRSQLLAAREAARRSGNPLSPQAEAAIRRFENPVMVSAQTGERSMPFEMEAAMRAYDMPYNMTAVPVAGQVTYPRPADFMHPEQMLTAYARTRAAQEAAETIGGGSTSAAFASGGPERVSPMAILGQVATAGGLSAATKYLAKFGSVPSAILGGTATYLGTTTIDPQKTLETLHLINVGAQRFNTATRGFSARLLGTGEGRAVMGAATRIGTERKVGEKQRATSYDYGTNLKNWKATTQALDNLTPEELANRLNKRMQPVKDFSPEMAQEASLTTMESVAFLKSKAQAIKNLNGTGNPMWQPPPAELIKFEKYNRYVRNPMAVLDDTETKGFIPPEGLEVLERVYPVLLLEMRSNLVDEYASAVEKNKPIAPDRLRLMKQFLGEPQEPIDKAAMQRNQAAMQQQKSQQVKRLTGNQAKIERQGLTPNK